MKRVKLSVKLSVKRGCVKRREGVREAVTCMALDPREVREVNVKPDFLDQREAREQVREAAMVLTCRHR
ncbi:hypothetical protein [Streptomyces sp. NPDC059929]|uniref:hypothetical protein n=1 Tax=Streptomyces sp. NPDC059929 TaxID=3347008 RepID=UPI003662D3AD